MDRPRNSFRLCFVSVVLVRAKTDEGRIRCLQRVAISEGRSNLQAHGYMPGQTVLSVPSGEFIETSGVHRKEEGDMLTK